MIRILLQVVILEYSISAMEDIPNQLKSNAPQNNSTNTTSHLKEEVDDQTQNLLDICLLLTDDMPSFFKKIEKCKRNFSSADENKTFVLNFCNSMLGENGSDANKQVENSVLGLTFDRHLVEHSWNGPTDVDTAGDASEAEYHTIEKPQLESPDPRRPSAKLASIESNLELKMEEEWSENDPKISYRSHIYIGTSKFPMSFKTSRVINTEESALKRLTGVQQSENNPSKSRT